MESAQLTTQAPAWVEEYIDQTQAAGKLKLKARTLEKFRLTGEGPAFYKFGSRVRYSISDLQSWIESRRRTSTSEAA